MLARFLQEQTAPKEPCMPATSMGGLQRLGAIHVDWQHAAPKGTGVFMLIGDMLAAI